MFNFFLVVEISLSFLHSFANFSEAFFSQCAKLIESKNYSAFVEQLLEKISLVLSLENESGTVSFF